MRIFETAIEIVKGSVVDQDVDAIVNAANTALRGGGVLTYYSGADERFPQDQVHLLLTHFDEVKLIKVSDLRPYPAPECDYWNKPFMVVPVATRN